MCSHTLKVASLFYYHKMRTFNSELMFLFAFENKEQVMKDSLSTPIPPLPHPPPRVFNRRLNPVRVRTAG